MRRFFLTSVFIAVPLVAAHAIQIINAAQTSSSNTVTATADAAGTMTTINITDAASSIAQIFGGGTGLPAFVDLAATSIDFVTMVGGALLQHYSGNFSISSGLGGSGIDYLSGSFTDAAFGLTTGNQLSVNIAQPPDTLTLSSSFIPAADLSAPNSLTFAMSNLTSTAPFSGGLQVDNLTIAPFTASFVATADASQQAVNTPEPMSLALFATGLLVLTCVRFRRQ
jgi:hypothetical protein